MISLPPDEVERRFTLLGLPNRFTDEEKRHLKTTAPIALPGDVMVFATPLANVGLNLLNLKVLCGVDPAKPPSFFDHPWYLEEAFMGQDCEPGWHCVYTHVLPDSISQSIDYASSLSGHGLVLPSAIEVTLMLFLHYVGTGEQLMQKKHTWCRELASQNRCVTMGAFGRNGLFISGHPRDFTSRGLGICAKVMR